MQAVVLSRLLFLAAQPEHPHSGKSVDLVAPVPMSTAGLQGEQPHLGVGVGGVSLHSPGNLSIPS